MQTVAACRSGDESITGGYLPACFLGRGCDLPPNAGCFKIDGEDAVCVVSFDTLEPSLKRALIVAVPEKCNPFGNFTDGYNAYKKAFIIEGLDSLADDLITLGPAQFGQHAGVQQNFQSFTLRMGDRSRVRSTPCKLGPLPSRNCLKLGFLPVSFS